MNVDVQKLKTTNFPEQQFLTPNDYLIILGDFGCIWDNSEEQEYWLKWHSQKNYTTLFIDGNHENHKLLNSFPVSEWNGGKVHFINNRIIHLMRGQVFTLENHTFFTLGGATSSDKQYRTLGTSYCPEEEITQTQITESMTNLALHDNKVDFILTHTVCDTVRKIINPYPLMESPSEKLLDCIYENIQYKWWINGHLHIDETYPNLKQICVFEKVLNLSQL